MAHQLHPKQMDRPIGAKVTMRDLVIPMNATSMDITASLTALLATAGFMKKSVPVVESNAPDVIGIVQGDVVYSRPSPLPFTPPDAAKVLEWATDTINNTPYVASQIITPPAAEINKPYVYTIPTGTFLDPEGKALTLWSFENKGQMPSWMSFDQATETFSGTPTETSVGVSTITVSATDPSFKGIATTFKLQVNSTTPPQGQICYIQSAYDKKPLISTSNGAVFGILKKEVAGFKLYFHHSPGNVPAPYTFTAPALVDISFCYRFSLETLPDLAFCEMGNSLVSATAGTAITLDDDASVNAKEIAEIFTLTGTTIPALSQTPELVNNIMTVYIRGQAVRYGIDYTLSGKQITWNATNAGYALAAGDDVIVAYAYAL